jgi:ribosome biogenesis GTPase
MMETQRVRAADGRGRHTTVHRELIVLPAGGLIIDTPGIRRVGLYEMSDGVDKVFSDIDELAGECRFADCGHEAEPGCAVRAAIEAGELTGRRLGSYRKLQRENEWAAARSDARARAELRAERADRSKAFAKQLRATYTFRNRQT